MFYTRPEVLAGRAPLEPCCTSSPTKKWNAGGGSCLTSIRGVVFELVRFGRSFCLSQNFLWRDNVPIPAVRSNLSASDGLIPSSLPSRVCLWLPPALHQKLAMIDLVVRTIVWLMMMMICGPSGQVPQRNEIPTTVKLWLSVQSHAKLKQNCDPVLGARGPSPACRTLIQPL